MRISNLHFNDFVTSVIQASQEGYELEYAHVELFMYVAEMRLKVPTIDATTVDVGSIQPEVKNASEAVLEAPSAIKKPGRPAGSANKSK